MNDPLFSDFSRVYFLEQNKYENYANRHSSGHCDPLTFQIFLNSSKLNDEDLVMDYIHEKIHQLQCQVYETSSGNTVQIARIGLDLFDSNNLYLSGTNQWLNEGLSMYINYKIRGNLNPEIPLYTFSDYAFYAFNLLLQKSGLSIEPFLRAAIIPPTDNNDPMIDLYNLMNIGPYVISQIGNVLAQKEGELNPYENRVQELENVFSRFFN